MRNCAFRNLGSRLNSNSVAVENCVDMRIGLSSHLIMHGIILTITLSWQALDARFVKPWMPVLCARGIARFALRSSRDPLLKSVMSSERA